MIHVADLAPIVFGLRKEGIYSVFALYADESADKRQQRWLVAGSFFGLAAQFPAVEKEWCERLAEDGVRFFHASDCTGLDGDFDFVARGLEKDETAAHKRAEAIRNDLATIVGNSRALGGIAVGLNLSAYLQATSRRAAQNLDELTTLAYKVLIRDCIKRIDRDWPQSAKIPIAFTFDERSNWKAAEEAYRKLKESDNDIARRMGAVIHTDDKTHPALQMADLMASETRYFLQGNVARPAFVRLKKQHAIYQIATIDKRQWLQMIQRNGPGPKHNR